ncbi:MAG TPA: DUF1810 domain-containing protein [Ginsengibacter sp.]|nr:DUF1810 domain-containing protein [Ginsengibacter sp.]
MTDNSINRFVKAQENIYGQVVKELQNGKKTSHWMWFIFPQIVGLGSSSTSKYYAIKTIAEAGEYLKHPVLGKRLLECSNILLKHKGKSAESIFGYPDYLKLQSSMTLFNYVDPGSMIFSNVLLKYYNGEKDAGTINILQSMDKD